MPLPMVQEAPDGRVYVRDATQVYCDTRANFQLDFSVTLPGLPAGADERIYVPGRSHALQNRTTIISGGPMPWALGDNVITNINTGLAAQAARNPPHVVPQNVSVEQAQETLKATLKEANP